MIQNLIVIVGFTLSHLLIAVITMLSVSWALRRKFDKEKLNITMQYLKGQQGTADTAYQEAQKAHDAAHAIMSSELQAFRQQNEQVVELRRFIANRFPAELDFAMECNWNIPSLAAKLLIGWRADRTTAHEN